ncbi:phosphodiesterase [Anaerotalea alkaliphila]|uniref:Phosphoesterase n=1 Tax=Anaerotalea alkaliphila TaxID=2662126 RepID=A0A7X5KMF3_9FIRM|nr:phosphodiesterase [Anaerotalea alkaliphila]NDL67759.1 phosphodiesterase [Anaerotalea alkaliphila]
MKLMVLSDIHGSDFYLEKALARFEAEAAAYLLVLGDFLYHGPRNPLPEGYDPKAVIARLNPLKGKIIAVRGNCDGEVDQMVLEFPILSDQSTVFYGGRRIFLHHGHHFSEENLPPLVPGDVFLQGHTHIPTVHQKAGIHILNPGSVALPKNGTPHSYGVLEEDGFKVKDLEGKTFLETKW